MAVTQVLLVEPFLPPGGMPMDLDPHQCAAKPKFTVCLPTAAASSDKLTKGFCWQRGRALWLRTWSIHSQRDRQVPEVGSIENPPGSEGGPDGPMWMSEVVAFVKDLDAEEVVFNTCAFQTSSRLKWFKPGKFAGRVSGLQTLARKCGCPAGFRHQQLVGKERTEMAAEYPEELCQEMARLIVKAWKRALDLEWWRFQVANKRSELSALQVKWWECKEKEE